MILTALAAASCHSPTEPAATNNTLAGSWSGSASRGPCGAGWREEWSSVTLMLHQTGATVSGEVFAPQGRHFPVSGSDADILNVGGLDNMNCYFFEFLILDRTLDAAGNVRRIAGVLQGQCCGTVAGNFEFVRP